jgi:hypothetical protein
MAEIGASYPLRVAPAKVRRPNQQPTLVIVGGNRSKPGDLTSDLPAELLGQSAAEGSFAKKT